MIELLIKRLVTLEPPKVAMSEEAFGTVAGTQLVAVFQSPLEGFAAQVALPARECRGAGRYSSATAMRNANLFDDLFMGEIQGS